MDKNQIEELRLKYIKNSPKGIPPEYIRLMSDDEVIDMDYFLNEDDDIFDDIDNDNNFDFEEIFSSDLFLPSFFCVCFFAGFFFPLFSLLSNFLLPKKTTLLPRIGGHKVGFLPYVIERIYE